MTLATEAVTKPGQYHQIVGEGMPISGDEHKRGDLWVQYTVAFPDQLSQEQKDAIRTLFK